MNGLILLLTLLASAQAVERVDRIELNRVMSPDGKTEHLTQYIFWRIQRVDLESDLHVAEWRLFQQVDARPTPTCDGYRLVWTDPKRERCVVGPIFVETISNYDPEIVDQKCLSSNKRRGFAVIK